MVRFPWRLILILGLFLPLFAYTNCSPSGLRSALSPNQSGGGGSSITPGSPSPSEGTLPQASPSPTINGFTYYIKTDWNIYPEPSLPARPEPGKINFDPTFGTPFVRVTASADGANCGTPYSYYPTFNMTNTHLLIHCGNDTFVGDFDPDSMRVTNKRKIPGAEFLLYEDALWSHTKNSVFYSHNFGLKIYEVDVTTNQLTVVLDATGILSTSEYIWQMSKSADDRFFAFTKKRNPDYVVTGFAVMERGTNRVVLNINRTQLDEVQIDKSGKFLLEKTGLESNTTVDNVKNILWNLETQQSADLYGRADRALGHSDMGSGFVVGHENWDNSALCRDLVVPKQPYLTLPIVIPGSWDKQYSNGSIHYSMLADNNGWVMVSSSDENAMPGLMRNELTQVSTDGKKAIRRLLHHRSLPVNYWAMPKATISFDGQFLAYTSNWGNTGRTDIYVAKIPPAAPRTPCGQQ